MMEFIRHDGFILRRDQIISFELDEENLIITATVKEHTKCRDFVMHYNTKYEAQSAFSRLVLSADAFSVGYDVKSGIEQAFCNIRSGFHHFENEIKTLRKEIEKLRKQMKKIGFKLEETT